MTCCFFNTPKEKNIIWRFVSLFVVTIALGTLPTTSFASFIQREWQSTGQNDLIYDTNSGLEWLKLTVTQGRFSYDTMQTQLLPGGEFFGFRYANAGEVNSLFNSFGLFMHGLDNTVADHFQIENYQAFFGITQQDIFSGNFVQNNYTFGLFDEVDPGNYYGLGNAHFYSFVLENFAFGYTKVAHYEWLDYRIDRSMGHYLVRQVPEPGTISLMLLGFSGIGFMFRRRTARMSRIS
jgi:hypothetical protein